MLCASSFRCFASAGIGKNRLCSVNATNLDLRIHFFRERSLNVHRNSINRYFDRLFCAENNII